MALGDPSGRPHGAAPRSSKHPVAGRCGCPTHRSRVIVQAMLAAPQSAFKPGSVGPISPSNPFCHRPSGGFGRRPRLIADRSPSTGRVSRPSGEPLPSPPASKVAINSRAPPRSSVGPRGSGSYAVCRATETPRVQPKGPEGVCGRFADGYRHLKPFGGLPKPVTRPVGRDGWLGTSTRGVHVTVGRRPSRARRCF